MSGYFVGFFFKIYIYKNIYQIYIQLETLFCLVHCSAQIEIERKFNGKMLLQAFKAYFSDASVQVHCSRNRVGKE